MSCDVGTWLGRGSFDLILDLVTGSIKGLMSLRKALTYHGTIRDVSSACVGHWSGPYGV